MILIAGYTLTEAHKRDAAVEAFADMVERARRYDGCLDLSIGADSVDPERINLFECWRDPQSWNAWRKVAKPPIWGAIEAQQSRPTPSPFAATTSADPRPGSREGAQRTKFQG
jgi:quinol monooxygenase YgiN